jgi:hypothetical protein
VTFRRYVIWATIALVIGLGILVGVIIWNPPWARSDLGNAGPGPSPGLCQYPSVCDSGVIGVGAGAVYWYWEDFPIELNGSHRHCQWGGASTEANASVGISMVIQAQVGVTAPLGALVGGCRYVCPSMELAAFPNPPGGWKDAIRPTKCQPIAPCPIEWCPPPPPQDVPIAPPIGEQGAVPSIPFGQPQPQPGAPGAPGVVPPVEPPVAEELPSVTNPVCPNPAATTDESCHGN